MRTGGPLAIRKWTKAMSKSSASNDARRAARTSAHAQTRQVIREPNPQDVLLASPTIDINLTDTDQDIDSPFAGNATATADAPAAADPQKSEETSTTAPVMSADMVARKKVLLILCSRNGTARQAISRFGNQMNLALEIVDNNPDQPSSIAEQLFAHRDAQFAIIYWGEPAGREPPGFAHPDRYAGFVLGFALGRLGRARVFILASEKTLPLPGFDRIMATQLDPTGTWQAQLARRMQSAGIEVDMSKLG